MYESFDSLYLNRIDYWSALSLPGDPNLSGQKRLTLDRLETHYGQETLRPRPFFPNPVKCLIELLELKKRGPYGAVLFSQVYPDMEPLSAPLQRLLEFHPLQAREVLGLTHLEETAGVEAIACLDWLLKDGEDGLVILSDIRPYRHQGEGDDVLVCLELSRKAGAVRLNGVNREAGHSKHLCDPWLKFAEAPVRGSLQPFSAEIFFQPTVQSHIGTFDRRENVSTHLFRV